MPNTKILVLEDDPRFAKQIKSDLTSMGYPNHEVKFNSCDFRTALADNAYDLFLLDILLGEEKTGIDVASELQLNTKAPFIFLSNSMEKQFVKHSQKIGASNYILKGNPNQLDIAITQALGTDPKKAKIRLGKQHTLVTKSDIVCISSSSYLATIHLKNGQDITISKSFTKLVEAINYPPLQRVHISFYVNMDLIAGYTTNTLILSRSVKRACKKKIFSAIPIGSHYKETVHAILNQE